MGYAYTQAVRSSCTPRAADQLRAARSHRQKAEILARFKESNARSAPFFLVCVGMALVNNISGLENFRAAKLVVLLSTCERESGSESG
jgi:hypothetical protein